MLLLLSVPECEALTTSGAVGWLDSAALLLISWWEDMKTSRPHILPYGEWTVTPQQGSPVSLRHWFTKTIYGTEASGVKKTYRSWPSILSCERCVNVPENQQRHVTV